MRYRLVEGYFNAWMVTVTMTMTTTRPPVPACRPRIAQVQRTNDLHMKLACMSMGLQMSMTKIKTIEDTQPAPPTP